MSTLTLTVNQTIQALDLALRANTPTIVTSSSGQGKSSIIRQLAAQYNLKLIDVRLSQVNQYDLLGFPKEIDGKMVYVPMENIPLKGEPLAIRTEALNSWQQTDKAFKTEIADLKSNLNVILNNAKKEKLIEKLSELEKQHSIHKKDYQNLPKYDGYLLFLDELNSADKYVQGAAYKLVLDREVGSHQLHEKCLVLAAGNRMQDKGLVSPLLSPMKSRLSHIEMRLDNREFLDYVADQVSKGLWHPLILGFLEFKPSLISNFNSDKDTTTFACPRTWEMLSKQLQVGLLNLDPKVSQVIVTGIIGMEAGAEFNTFLNFMKDIPNVNDIIADPLNAKMPTSLGAQWAIGSYLYDKIDKTNYSKIVQYIDRIPEADLKVLTFRMMIPSYPNVIQAPLVAKAMSTIRSRLQKANTP